MLCKESGDPILRLFNIPQALCHTDEHSGMSQERIEELMLDSTKLVKDVGTMLEGKRAVEEGLIDEVGGIRDALNKLHEMIDEKMENTDKNYEMT